MIHRFSSLAICGIALVGIIAMVQPRFSHSARFEHIIVDASGTRLSGLFAGRTPTSAQLAYYNLYSPSFGRRVQAQRTAAGCAVATSSSRESSTWKRALRELSTWTAEAAPPPMCLQTATRDGDCAGGSCIQTFCADAGPGCTNQLSACCNVTSGCGS